MTLADYLHDRRISAAEFAEKLGVHRSTVSRWILPPSDGGETYRPSWDQIANISRVTYGLVTANDFMPSLAPACPAASGGGDVEQVG